MEKTSSLMCNYSPIWTSFPKGPCKCLTLSRIAFKVRGLWGFFVKIYLIKILPCVCLIYHFQIISNDFKVNPHPLDIDARIQVQIDETEPLQDDE